MTQPGQWGVYERVLGEDFAKLGQPLQEFLAIQRDVVVRGRFDVRGRGGVVGRLLGACFGFPAPGKDVDVQLSVSRAPEGETWRREIGGEVLSTYQTSLGTELVESLWPVTIYHKLEVDQGALIHRSVRIRVFGIGLPSSLSPSVVSSGTPTAGGWTVSVLVEFPVIGSVLQYEGDVALEEDSFDRPSRSYR